MGSLKDKVQDSLKRFSFFVELVKKNQTNKQTNKTKQNKQKKNTLIDLRYKKNIMTLFTN